MTNHLLMNYRLEISGLLLVYLFVSSIAIGQPDSLFYHDHGFESQVGINNATADAGRLVARFTPAG